MSKYAKGRKAIAECQRSGQKMRYRDLVEDGHIPGLLVHPDWYEPKHPQETPVRLDDPIALYKPAPEISVPGGYGNAENLADNAEPLVLAPTARCTYIWDDVTAGMTHVRLEQAMTYTIGQRISMGLDGGGYFGSVITSTADTPAFVVPFTTPFPDTGPSASGGNQVCIGDVVAMPAVQTFTVTIDEWNGGTDHGFTLYGGNKGSISPSLAYIVVDEGLISEVVEITFYDSGSGLEIFSSTQNPDTFLFGTPPVNRFATMLFTTFSRIEIDHSGGTLVLDNEDIAFGGDLDHDSSAEWIGYGDFYYPDVPKVWTNADIGLSYDVRFIV